MGFRFWLILASATCALACSSRTRSERDPGAGGVGGTTTDGAVPLDREQACNVVAQVTCEKIGGCWPAVMRMLYGDIDGCVERSSLGCAAPAPLGDVATPQAIVDCAMAYDAVGCDSLVDERPISECAIAGTLANGSVCAEGRQCESGYCELRDSCGNCAAPLPVDGEPCRAADSRCAKPHYCDADGVCRLRLGPGESCDATRTCLPSHNCIEGTCVARALAGEACDAVALTAPQCYDQLGLTCTAAGVCTTVRFAGPGEACGEVDGDTVHCENGGFCPVESGTTGVCVAVAGDGESCSNELGPYCRRPAWCLEGTCTVVDPSTCM